MATVTFEEYQNLAARTAYQHENEHVNYAMGLSGETGELIDLFKKFLFHKHPIPSEEIKKEAGDVLWYTSQIMRIYDISIEDIFLKLNQTNDVIEKSKNEGNVENLIMISCLNLSHSVGDISGYIDGLTMVSGFYSTEYLKGKVSNVLRNVHFLTNIAGLTVEEVAEANIEKLKARYPDGFDAERSINRVE